MKRILAVFVLILCVLGFAFMNLSAQKGSGLFLWNQDAAIFVTENVWPERDNPVHKTIRLVELFPDLPENYAYFDYAAKARELDSVLFGFANNPSAVSPSYIRTNPATWNPIGYWIDQPRVPSVYEPLVTGYLKRTFGLPTYLGDSRVISSGSEPITTISAVLGSSYAGIDKSAQAFGSSIYDFVEMTLSSYDTGSELVHNIGAQGQSFWYDIFPQIMFARLYELYPDTEYMKEMVLNGADQWLEALPYLQKDGIVSYEFVGYNVVLEAPTTVGHHIEPPNGGLAFLFYSAYVLTEEEKYLDGAKEVLDYLETYQKNPNYEAMTDYAPFVAAALNRRFGTTYDVSKLLDFLFESDSAFRPGWRVMNGTFGGYAVDGFVGQSGDYGFAMNSFHLASVLAPMVKYDTRYAAVIGKYLLNLVNNAKAFFPQSISLDRQTMTRYLDYDVQGSLCYEGFRNNYGGVNGLAMGDATTMFGQPSDLSIYSSAFIGALGGMVSKTNVHGILKIDLNKTDSYGVNTYPQSLTYNPYGETRTVKYRPQTVERYDLFDAVTKEVVARNVKGDVNVRLSTKEARVLIELPANSRFDKSGDQVLVQGIVVGTYQSAVNILNLSSRQELTASSDIRFSYQAPKGDEVVRMQIYFGTILAYDGAPLQTYRYDKSKLPDTDYTMKVVITTSSGRSDVASKRVVAR
jgi:hypothetical protein